MKQSSKKHAFTNSVGDTFGLYPMNPLEEQLVREQMQIEWKEAGKILPNKPVYSVTNAAGETQSIQVNDEKEAESVGLAVEWAAYKAANSAFEQEYSERYMMSCFSCIQANPDDYPEWKKRMKIRRLPIPEDEADKLVSFGKTWVIRSTDDISGFIFACTRTMTNMSEEAAKAAEDKFRLTLEGALAQFPGAE
jgi:hypothetical protein